MAANDEDEASEDQGERVPNNPAARLLAFVTGFRDLPRFHKADRMPTGQAVAILLGIDPVDPPRLMRELALLLDLPRQAREAIRATDAVPDEFAAEFDAIDEWFHFADNLAGYATQPAGQVTNEMVKALKLCSGLLSLHAAEPVPTLVKLSKVRDEANALLSEVVAADLDNPDLAKLLAYHLHRIVEALDTYRITGDAPARAAAAEAVGDLLLLGSTRNEFSKKDRTWVDRFWDVLSRTVDLGSAFGLTLAAGHAVMAALGTGLHP